MITVVGSSGCWLLKRSLRVTGEVCGVLRAKQHRRKQCYPAPGPFSLLKIQRDENLVAFCD